MTAAATDPDPRAATLLARRGRARPDTPAARILAELTAHPEGWYYEQLAVRLSGDAGHGTAAVRLALDGLLAAGTVRSIPVRRHCGDLRTLYYIPPEEADA